MKKQILVLLLICFFIPFVHGEVIQDEPSLTVEVENTLFSPTAKVKEGIVFIPKVENVKRTKLWFLTIQDEKNKKVREFIGKKTMPELVVWDGLDVNGNPARDGTYSYKFFVKADKSNLIVEESNLILDSTQPFVSLKAAYDVYFVKPEDEKVSRNINIYLSEGDENGVDYSKSYIKVLNFNNKEVKTFKFEDKIPEFITWDGMEEIYNMPLPLGNYRILFSVTDKAGNEASVETEISIVPMPVEPEPAKVEEEIIVKQEERGLVINLSSQVLFDVSKSDLRPEAEKALSEVAAILRVYPKNKVLIEGHTDSSGRAEKNMVLSLERAQSVFNYLIENGIDRDRMDVFGFGDTKPVAPNDNPRGKEQNRRVEVVILKADSEESKPEENNKENEPADNLQTVSADNNEIIEDSSDMPQLSEQQPEDSPEQITEELPEVNEPETFLETESE